MAMAKLANTKNRLQIYTEVYFLKDTATQWSDTIIPGCPYYNGGVMPETYEFKDIVDWADNYPEDWIKLSMTIKEL